MVVSAVRASAVVALACLVMSFGGGNLPAVAAAAVPLPVAHAGDPAPTPTGEPAGAAASSAVAPAARDGLLGGSWRTSDDVAMTASGDATGFHILLATARSGYAWRTVTTLWEPGVETDQWIGTTCLTASSRRAVVVYAPRAFTNNPVLFERGGFAAVVDLETGKVTKLRPRFSLAYHNPGCGAGEQAVLTQSGTTGLGRTRLFTVDTERGTLSAPIVVAGQVTSARPVRGGIVAALGGRLVQVDRTGAPRTLMTTRGVPFGLAVDGAGGLTFLDRTGTTVRVRHLRAGATRTLAAGPLTGMAVRPGAGGRVFVTGRPTSAAAMPSYVGLVPVDSRAELSSHGQLALTHVASRHLGGRWSMRDTAPEPGRAEEVRIEATSLVTRRALSFAVTPEAAGQAPAAASGGASGGAVAPGQDPLSRSRATAAAASPSDPVDTDRVCAVARNDVRTQVYQPSPPQVEWAADLAVQSALTVQRPANWKFAGLPAYSPQSLFPPIPLDGGGRVPAQILLGVLAQESNLWQASNHAVEGVPGNPLVGNFYGRVGESGWDIDWNKADCGYGIAQITDGMRLGQTSPWSPTQQRAIAVDYAANIAAGLRMLQDKWNQIHAYGLTVNGGNPRYLETWFYAVWAYNTGFYPNLVPNQPWGLGWSNNPINPDYPANRTPFLERGYDDARTPNEWPYPEKVIGWAAYPIAKSEPWGHGYLQAWWTTELNRTTAKPPIDLFCSPVVNDCYPGVDHPDGDGACARSDFKCWFHEIVAWKTDCATNCGNESLAYAPGSPEPADYAENYPPSCSTSGLPSNALIIDDLPESIPSVRACAKTWTGAGTFGLEFTPENRNGTVYYPGKVDFHQVGGGFGGHFWFAHTRTDSPTGRRLKVTGTWTLNRELRQWARVMVHMPDHGAHTQQARYEVHLGDGTVKQRTVLQRTREHRWVSLGVFQFAGTPKIVLNNIAGIADGSEDIAYDAVAFQPLERKPAQFVAALGDSYSSGEGASRGSGDDYYQETDNNGLNDYRNACHRSKFAWSRKATLAGDEATIGARADAWDPALDYHLLACSGDQTENMLPADGPRNAFGDVNRGQFREVGEIDRGFLDENTTLVTFSIGGNDARFGDVLHKCITNLIPYCPDEVLEGESEPMSVTVPREMRTRVKASVSMALDAVHTAAPNAKIVLMGYPHLFTFDCAGVSMGEKLWLDSMADVLAEEMASTVAGRPYATFADPRTEFAGRGACAVNAAINAVVLTRTEGDGPLSKEPVSRESFHPNLDGTTLYANVLNRSLRSMDL